MKKKIGLILSYIGLVLIYHLLTTFSDWPPAYLQVALLPLFFLLLLKIKFQQFYFPRLVLLCSLVIALVWFISIDQRHNIVGSQVVLAQLSDDSRGKETRKLRIKLTQATEKDFGISVDDLPYKLRTSADVLELLQDRQDLVGILRGDKNELEFFDNGPYIGTLSEFPLMSELEQPLFWAKKVSSITVPMVPLNETRYFFAHLINSRFAEDSEEVYLRSSAAFVPVWKTRDHLAYSRFLIGNYFLERLLESEEYDLGTARCVAKAYQRAAHLVNSNSAPELAAAIFNNQAVLYYLDSIFNGHATSRKKAKKLFTKAQDLRSIQESLFSSDLARMNLMMLQTARGHTRKNKS